MSLPRPLFDHLVVNARTRMDEAEACYRRLGFDLTPRGYHTLGSLNHCAVFGSDYLELVGVDPDARQVRGEILRFPEGLNGIVFATEDAAALHTTLAKAGAPVEPPADFARPVTLPEGEREARFRVVRVKAEAAPYGRVYFCQHMTPELVWRDEWRHHPNGAFAIARAVIAATDPDATASLYRRLFGDEAVRPTMGGFSLAAGTARLDILTPDAVAALWHVTPPEHDQPVGVTLLTRSLADAAVLLSRTGARIEAERILVPAASAFGAVLEFVA